MDVGRFEGSPTFAHNGLGYELVLIRLPCSKYSLRQHLGSSGTIKQIKPGLINQHVN